MVSPCVQANAFLLASPILQYGGPHGEDGKLPADNSAKAFEAREGVWNAGTARFLKSEPLQGYGILNLSRQRDAGQRVCSSRACGPDTHPACKVAFALQSYTGNQKAAGSESILRTDCDTAAVRLAAGMDSGMQALAWLATPDAMFDRPCMRMVSCCLCAYASGNSVAAILPAIPMLVVAAPDVLFW